MSYEPSPFEARKCAHLKVTASNCNAIVILRCEASSPSLEG
jgi:hypothetical protein